MAHQEEGWPLGLQPLNGRAGLFRSHEYVFGSTSFHTLLSASATSSTDFSSDLDTQSTGSFFHDNSTTLGTLMGVSTIGNNLSDLIPRRSSSSSSSSSSSVAKGRPRPSEVIPGVKKKKAQLRCKTSWCFSLCPKYNTDARNTNPSNNPPSLAQFLASERRAANGNHNFIYGPDGLALAPPVVEPNSLFVNGCVAPPRSSPMLGLGLMENGDKGCGIPFLLYCVCGQDHPLN